MKGMRGRFLRKLKSISTITSLKEGLIFQLNSDYFERQTFHKEQHSESNLPKLINEVEDEKEDFFFEAEDLTTPHEMSKEPSPLYSPREMPKDSSPMNDARADKASSESNIVDLGKETHTLLSDFELKCPPGGEDSVVLYTTSVRGIRKTFEDCSKIRFLLESTKVVFSERDVSMDIGFREELWKVVGGRVIPPRLFIRGRDIGGVDKVVRLNEQGRLKELLEGIPKNTSTCKCRECGGVRFVLCGKCNGSRKVKNNGEDCEVISSVSCVECNENGLVKCHVCC